MSARIPTIHEVHDSKFSLSGGLEVLTSILSNDKLKHGNLMYMTPQVYTI
jgi:hypothetical protein